MILGFVKKSFGKVRLGLKRFMVNRVGTKEKHLLLISPSKNPLLSDKLLANFSDSWGIICLDSEIKTDEKRVKKQIKYELSDLESSEQVQLLDNDVKKSASVFDCIISLSSTTPKAISFGSEDSLTQILHQDIVSSLFLGKYATTHLASNGICLIQGCDTTYFSKNHSNPLEQLQMSQAHYTNLSLGANSLEQLLQPNALCLSFLFPQFAQINPTDIKPEELNETFVYEEKYQKDVQMLVKFIRKWADGYQLPISGTFVQFKKEQGKIYPQYL